MKYIKYISSLLLVIGALAILGCWLYGSPEAEGSKYVDIALKVAYVYMGLAIVVAVVFPVINFGKNPKGALNSLIGLGILAVLVGVAYGLSSDAPITLGDKSIYDDSFGLRVSDIMIYMSYFLGVAAILAIAIGEIRNAFK